MVDAALQEGLLHRIDPVDLPEPNSPKLNKDNLSLLPMREQVVCGLARSLSDEIILFPYLF